MNDHEIMILSFILVMRHEHLHSVVCVYYVLPCILVSDEMS